MSIPSCFTTAAAPSMLFIAETSTLPGPSRRMKLSSRIPATIPAGDGAPHTIGVVPLDAPKSLSDEEVYAVAAYILLNGIIAEGDMNAQTLPNVQMAYRDSFIPFARQN